VRLLTKAAAVVVVLGLVIFFGGEQLLTQETREAVSLESAAGQDTVQQETYVSEVIISAPWAERNLMYDGEASPPGQFGYHVNDETEMGPSCFAVAPNGDIYIVDPLNKRLQKYTPGGSFVSTIPFASLGKDLRTISVVDLCVDRDDNIYLMLYGPRADWDKATEDNMGRVLKCDQQGNLLQTYPVLTGVASTANFVYCDEFGRVLYAYPWSGQESGFYQVGTSEQAFSLSEQTNSKKTGFVGFSTAALNSNLYFKPAATLVKFGLGMLRKIAFTGDTVIVANAVQGEFFGTDREGNIYMEFWDKKHSLVGIRKYDPSGQQLAEFKYMCEEPYNLASASAGAVRSKILGEGGDLYALCSSPQEGISVLKWTQQQK
jgi:hypothetical protein